MKLEINLPELRKPANPFKNEGVKALAIVFGGIMLICAAVYAVKLAPKKRTLVLPAATEAERTAIPQATIVPAATELPTGIPTVEPTPVLEETLEATASPTVGVTPPPETNLWP